MMAPEGEAMADLWDRYTMRYGGYRPATLESFIDRGCASFDPVADAYTVWCDHGLNGGTGFTDCPGDPATCTAAPFTVGLSAEFR